MAEPVEGNSTGTAAPVTEPTADVHITGPGADIASWRELVTDPDLAAWKGLDRFGGHEVDAGEAVTGLVKSYREMEQRMGELSNQKAIPGADATSEDWAEFYKRLPGYPEEASKYEVEGPKLPNGVLSQEGYEEFLKMAHEEGYRTNQVDRAVRWFENYFSNGILAQQEADTKAMHAAQQALEEKWGAQYDYRMAVAQQGMMNAFGSLDFLQNVVGKDSEGNDRLLGNIPQFMTMAYEWAVNNGHHRHVAGVPGGPSSIQEAQAKIQEARTAHHLGQLSTAQFDDIMRRHGPLAYSEPTPGEDMGDLAPMTIRDFQTAEEIDRIEEQLAQRQGRR